MWDDHRHNSDASGFWVDKFGGVAAMYLNGRKGVPKTDGWYYYICEFSWGIDIRTIQFTVDGGWNTFVDFEGNVQGKAFTKEDKYYIGYAPIQDGLYIPNNSEIIDDMLDEIITLRRTDPLLNGEIRYDSDEEQTKWEYIERLEDLLTEAKENLRECEANGWTSYF